MNDNAVTISISLSPRSAGALAQVIKRLQRRDLGRDDLNLANPHQPDEQGEAEQAIDELERALAKAGFEPR